MSVEFDLEAKQDVRHVLADVEKRLLNPKPLKQATFPEGYFAHDLNIYVRMVVTPERDGLETHHFRAVFENIPSESDVNRLDGDFSAGFLQRVSQ